MNKFVRCISVISGLSKSKDCEHRKKSKSKHVKTWQPWPTRRWSTMPRVGTNSCMYSWRCPNVVLPHRLSRSCYIRRSQWQHPNSEQIPFWIWCFAKLDTRCRIGTGSKCTCYSTDMFFQTGSLTGKKGLSLFCGKLKRGILKPAWLLPYPTRTFERSKSWTLKSTTLGEASCCCHQLPSVRLDPM